jgi:protein TonB
VIHRRVKVFRGRREKQATGAAVAGTAVFHAVALVALFSSTGMVAEIKPPVYAIELIAAPAPRPEPQRRAPEAIQRPAERPIPVERSRRTSVAETPPPPTAQPEEKEPAPRTDPVEPLPEVEPSTGSDPGTVKTEGVEFPYPEYLRNIVAQVYRQWNRPKGNVSLRAEVQFFVHRDGSLSGVRFIRRSGSFGFDLEAQGAIERASSAFGRLPEGFANDVLPVHFFFDPSSIR